jgi:hypothetical protein
MFLGTVIGEALILHSYYIILGYVLDLEFSISESTALYSCIHVVWFRHTQILLWNLFLNWQLQDLSALSQQCSLSCFVVFCLVQCVLLYLRTSKGFGLGVLITLRFTHISEPFNHKTCLLYLILSSVIPTFYIIWSFVTDQCAKALNSTSQSNSNQRPSHHEWKSTSWGTRKKPIEERSR